MSYEVKQALEELQQTALAKIARQDEQIAELRAAVDGGMAESKRRMFGAPAGSVGSTTTHEHKAWNAFLRTGDAAEVKSLNTATPDQGGYALPKVIASSVEAVMVRVSPLRDYVTVARTDTSDYHQLVSLRGWTSSWVGETAARPATTATTFADIAPTIGEIYANPFASQRMLDDANFDVPSWLVGEIGEAFGEPEADSLITGNGTNKPKGITSYTTAATADGARAFGTIEHVATGVAGDWAASNKADTLLQTLYKLKARHRREAAWLMHPSTLQSIMTFKEATTNAFLIKQAVVEGQPPTLFGRPIIESEFMPAIGANALAVAVANWKKAYLLVDRTDVRVLVDPYTDKPNVGYYCTKRCGGALMDSEAIKFVKFAAA